MPKITYQQLGYRALNSNRDKENDGKILPIDINYDHEDYLLIMEMETFDNYHFREFMLKWFMESDFMGYLKNTLPLLELFNRAALSQFKGYDETAFNKLLDDLSEPEKVLQLGKFIEGYKKMQAIYEKIQPVDMTKHKLQT
jgi:hypothetical protein